MPHSCPIGDLIFGMDQLQAPECVSQNPRWSVKGGGCCICLSHLKMVIRACHFPSISARFPASRNVIQ